MLIDQIANEIIIASVIKGTNKLSVIAEELGYQPMLILNSLYKAEEDGKLVYVKKKDIINVSPDVEIDSLQLTEALEDSMGVLETFISYRNKVERDEAFEDIRAFIPMLPELHLKIALKMNKNLASYELADPVDKDSVYTFYTLKENLDKKWGTKAFDVKNSLPVKAVRKAERKAAKEAQNAKKDAK